MSTLADADKVVRLMETKRKISAPGFVNEQPLKPAIEEIIKSLTAKEGEMDDIQDNVFVTRTSRLKMVASIEDFSPLEIAWRLGVSSG